MPVHDWTRVKAGIFHDFHHAWIEEIKRFLNAELLPDDYYALAEQFAGPFGPDVLTLQERSEEKEVATHPPSHGGGTAVLTAPPDVALVGETEMEFYRRKQNAVAVRHVSGDRLVAMIEIVSPGNKSGRRPFRSFVEKAAELLDQQVHLLLIDVLPPTSRDPNGIHAAIWEEIAGEEDYSLDPDKRLTLAAYEAALAVRAYVEHFAVGEELCEMPLFLEPGSHVRVPLSRTYESAFQAVPRRWKAVLEGGDT